MGRILQDTNEIIMYQSDVFVAPITPKDAEGTDITIDGQTVAGLTFKAYKYLDDTTATITVTGLAHSATVINVTFTAAQTSGVTPGTYWYILAGTIGGSARTLAKSQITILRKT